MRKFESVRGTWVEIKTRKTSIFSWHCISRNIANIATATVLQDQSLKFLASKCVTFCMRSVPTECYCSWCCVLDIHSELVPTSTVISRTETRGSYLRWMMFRCQVSRCHHMYCQHKRLLSVWLSIMRHIVTGERWARRHDMKTTNNYRKTNRNSYHFSTPSQNHVMVLRYLNIASSPFTW
jgi:hypothetical protein